MCVYIYIYICSYCFFWWLCWKFEKSYQLLWWVLWISQTRELQQDTSRPGLTVKREMTRWWVLVSQLGENCRGWNEDGTIILYSMAGFKRHAWVLKKTTSRTLQHSQTLRRASGLTVQRFASIIWRTDFVLVLSVSSYKRIQKARFMTQHCICGFWTRILEHFWSRLTEDRWCPAAFFASKLLFWLLKAKYWRGRRLADQEVFKTRMVEEHLERSVCLCAFGKWGITVFRSSSPFTQPRSTLTGNRLTMSNGDVREKTEPKMFCWCPELQRSNTTDINDITTKIDYSSNHFNAVAE